MAKGTLTFEFDSITDLFCQMMAMLNGVGGKHPATVLAPPEQFKTVEPVEPAAVKTEPAFAPEKPAQAAPLKAEPPVEAKPEPVEAKPEQADGPEKPAQQQEVARQSEQQAETVTLETLSSVPYPELLDFCRRHPGANVNPEKNAATFFRDLVESRVKRYLESQAK